MNCKVCCMGYFLFFALLCLKTSPQDVVIVDAVKCTHENGAGVAEIIVDNSDPEFFTNGTFTQGSFSGGYLDNYLYAMSSDSSLKTAYWRLDIPIPGKYDVSAYYTTGSNRSSHVHYRLLHESSAAEIEIDQKTGGNWEVMGRFPFNTGTYTVQVSNRITSGIIESITIDNGDALFETIGSWTPGTVSPGFQDDYLFAGCGATSSSQARWNMPVFIPGNYKISAWFSVGPNRNQNTCYLIPTSNGILEKFVSQKSGEDGWHSLGTYNFPTGLAQVTLHNIGDPDTVVIADALRAEYSEHQGAIPPEIEILTEEPPLPSAYEPFPVKAQVLSFDEISSVSLVKWETPGDEKSFPMFDDGLHHDNQAGDNIFGGQLVAGDPATILKYKVCAQTIKGAEACSTELQCLTAYDEWTSPELRLVFGYSIKTPELIDALVERVRQGNFNTVCVSVRSIADAYYESSYEPWSPGIPEGFDPLEYLIQKAHDTTGGKQYINVHPLVLVYRVLTTDTPPPGHVLDLHPEWASENFAGETFLVDRMYQDQGVPEVQDYLIDVFMEIVKKYDIDGFNLDFIRYREQDSGYNPIALQYFHQFTGRTDRPPIDDPEWGAWRREQVTNFVKRMYANILKVKPHVLLTIDGVCWNDLKPVLEENRFFKDTFQNYPQWLEKHYIDGVLGMAYRAEHNPELATEFDQWLGFLDSIKQDRKSVPIVGAYKNHIQNSVIQLHRIRQSGADWLCVFSDGSVNIERSSPEIFYNACSSQLFPSPAAVPEYSWKIETGKGVVMGKILCNTEPQRRIKVKLGSARETITDLCGFYVFFDVAPGSHELTVLDQVERIRDRRTITLDAQRVLEQDIQLSTSTLMLR